MQTCKKCLDPHLGRKHLVRFAEAGGYQIEFARIRGYCYLCSFLEGFEAYAEYRLSKYGHPGET